MAEVGGSPGMSVDQVISLIADRSAGALVTPGVLTLADLLANFPPSVDNLGKYARVSDLYGSVDEIVRCRFDGVAYRWVPVRTDYNMTHAGTGSVDLRPLFTPPTVRAPTTLTGNVTYVPSTVNAYIGQRFRVVTGGLGIYIATVTGLVGSNLSLLGNKVTDIEYSAGGWFAVSG